MSRTRCKTIRIEGDKLKTIDKEIEKAINDFFLDESFEYVNHSLERVTEPRVLLTHGQTDNAVIYEPKDDRLRTHHNYVKGAVDYCLFYLLTIMYIDYSEAKLDVTGVGVISAEKVKRSIKERKKIEMPHFALASDKINEEE